MKNIRKLALLILVGVAIPAFADEFVIMNETISMTSANNGFYFIYNTNKGPVNWVSPVNYRDGQVYFYYEILSQPTTTTCYLSFDIWGDWDGVSHYTESAASMSAALNGAGSISTFSSSPSTWYPNPTNGPVNFEDRTTFWRWGIVHWFSKSPNYLLAPIHWSDDPESWEAWEDNYLWLPLQVKVIIVAVSQGSTFSGWDNYMTPSTKHPVPTYGIDYANELTSKVVPSTDEYSANADMSGAVNGGDQKLLLMPGLDMYFRTKASAGMEASDIQHLVVPSRPTAVPSYSVDYANEQTVENISTAVEYSTSSSFTNPSTGTGNKVALSPGQDLFFRYKANSTAFHSNSFQLDVANRPTTPTVTIDFINEVTSAIPGTMEYSENASMSGATTGGNTTIPVTPGTDLYFRYKSTASQFRSGIQTLDVPARPENPAVTINFTNEVTSSIPGTMEYSENASMSPATTGGNTAIAVTPGTDLYFRYKPTASQFRSGIQTLDVPARPGNPAITINFANEVTSSIPGTMEYSENASMSPATTGGNTAIAVTPGTDLYFRYKSTTSQFRSGIQTLDVPARPGNPAVTINFTNEVTSSIPGTMEYSENASMSGATTGGNTTIPVTPGIDLYFRYKSTASQFRSGIQTLDVPARPGNPAVTINFANEVTSAIPGTMEYSENASMSPATTGGNTAIAVTPGTNLYFRYKSTASQFRSGIQTLDVPARPGNPAVTINFASEVTSAIPGTMEYSENASMSPATTGGNTAIAVTPGTDLYFRYKSTASQFRSGIQTLEVPARPATPLYTIDFANEKTLEIVPADDEYSVSADMSDALPGDGNKLSLTPGNDCFLRIKHTTSSFASDNFHLVVPERPVINAEVGDTVKTVSFTASVSFPEETTGFDTDDIEITNAEVELAAAMTIRISPVATGEVTLMIKPNAVPEGNFASELFTTYYKKTTTSVEDESESDGFIQVHPNPVEDCLDIELSADSDFPVEITLINSNGIIALYETMRSANIQLDVKGISPGIYILKAIDSVGRVTSLKLFKR